MKRPKKCPGSADGNSVLCSAFGMLPGYSTVSLATVEGLVRACLLRLPHRSVPVNWSAIDWQQEVQQIAALAVVQAVHDSVLARGDDVGGMIFRRVDGEIRNTQRREWGFGRRSQPIVADIPAVDEISENDFGRLDMVVGPQHLYDDLRQAMLQLPDAQRSVILLLFFEELTEAKAARKLDLSQPAVNRLKRAALMALKRYFSEKPATFSSRVAKKVLRNETSFQRPHKL